MRNLRGDGQYSGVAVIGGAGVGKTRLVAEAARLAEQDGWVTCSVVGTVAAQSIPLGAFAEWIDGTGQVVSLVSTVVAALIEQSAGKPLLVTVDDAQLLDDASAFVIHQLVRRQAASILMTVRTGPSVAATVSKLWKDEYLLRLDLEPLTYQASNGLLEVALGGAVDSRAVERLWDLTQGNVLFLYQIVRQELQSGRLAPSATVWQWSGEMTASPTLVDLVDLYVGAAPEGILEIVDLIAVAEPLELDYLTVLTEPSLVERAEKSALVTLGTASPNYVVRLSHPLYGEVRRANMGRLRAARLRGRIAKAMVMSRPAAKTVDQVRLALLWLESDLTNDADILRDGAVQAFLRLDLELTNRLCEAALAAGAGIDARLIYALSLYSLGHAVEAERALDELPDSVPDFVWVTAVMIRAATRQFFLGRPDESWALVDAALERAAVEARPQLEVLRVTQLAMAARPADAAGYAAVLDVSALDPLAAAILACGEVIALGDLGLVDAAAAVVDTCNRQAADSPQAAHQLVALNLLYAESLVLGGSISDAQTLGSRLEGQWANVPGDPSAVAVAIMGVASYASGDIGAAQEQLAAAIANIEPRHGRSGGLYLFWLYYTEALACAGQVEAATAALSRVEHYRHPSYVFLESNRLRVAGWVAAVQGRIPDAVALAGEAADFACAHGQFAREVMSLQAAIQFGDRSRTHRLAELLSSVEGRRVSLVAHWAKAFSDSDGDELLSVSLGLEDMGDRIAAADAAAHAALAFNETDRRRSRLSATTRATELIAQCGAMTPATRAAAAASKLSDRERQIAKMVGDDLSNKQIADVLVMSIRTVEGHVYRACTKLGLNNRSELAKFISDYGRRATG